MPCRTVTRSAALLYVVLLAPCALRLAPCTRPHARTPHDRLQAFLPPVALVNNHCRQNRVRRPAAKFAHESTMQQLGNDMKRRCVERNVPATQTSSIFKCLYNAHVNTSITRQTPEYLVFGRCFRFEELVSNEQGERDGNFVRVLTSIKNTRASTATPVEIKGLGSCSKLYGESGGRAGNVRVANRALRGARVPTKKKGQTWVICVTLFMVVE